MAIKSKERKDIEEKYKWDLTLIYKNASDWDKDYALVKKEAEKFLKFKGKLTKDANTLLKALKANEAIMLKLNRLANYANLKNDEDTRDTASTKLKNRIDALDTKVGEMFAFFDPELLQLDKQKVDTFMKENADLKEYKHFLYDVLRFKPHTLTFEEEKIINSATEVLSLPQKVYSKLSNADIKFNEIEDVNGESVEITQSNYIKYVSSQDRDVRKRAFDAYYESYKSLKNTFAEMLIGDIKANYFISKNRKYKNPLEMSLFANNINLQVYTNLIKTVNNNLDKFHKYVRLKKKVLGLDEMHMYDFYVDLIKEYDIEYPYEDAIKLIFKSLKPLGEGYISNANRVFDERWIDVYENTGKKSGAYSEHGYDTPPYILINYDGRLNGVSTSTHELGHSMHTLYSSSNQPYIYHHYPIFLAEIASNVNEMLLNMYMLDHAENDLQRLSLINGFLESVKGSIYRQTMFAEFEKEIYEMEGNDEALTEETLSDVYYQLNKKYYGDDIISDEEIRYEWMRIPHFYYQFYVYQYATGLTAAFFIAKDLYEDKGNMRERYIEFLSSGSSDYPLELLNKLGVDMTSEEPITRILEYFDEQLDKFEEIKIKSKR